MTKYTQSLKENTLVKYIFVGGFSFAIELLTLITLSSYFHFGAVLSVGISFWVGLIISFVLQKFLAFNNNSVKTNHLLKQTVLYVALVILNYIFTLYFVDALIQYIGLIPSRTIALILTTIWNFIIYKRIIFPATPAAKQTPQPHLKASWMRTIFYILCVLLGLFLLGYVALGAFSRPMADDLIFLNGYGLSDFLANLNYLYTVNGRLTTLTIYLLGFTIPIISQLTPLLTFLILGTGLYLITTQLLRDRISVSMRHPTILLSTLATLSAFAILIPSAQSSVFWFSAAVVHIWSYGFILILSALYLSMRRGQQIDATPRRTLALYFLATGVVALFGEMPALTIIAIHLFALVVDFIRKDNSFIRLTLSGLLAGVASFCWLYFAPASIARRTIIEASGGLTAIDFLKSLPNEIIENITIELPYLYENISLLIAFFCFALLLGSYVSRKNAIKTSDILLWVSIAILTSLFHFINFSLTYLAGGSVPLRIYASSTLGILFSTYLIGFIVGYALKQIHPYSRGLAVGSLVTLAIALALQSSLYLPSIHSLAKELKTHAISWDARDNYIKNQIKLGNCSIHTASLPIGDIGDIDQNPAHWINRQGIENYYKSPSHPLYWNTCDITGTGKFGL